MPVGEHAGSKHQLLVVHRARFSWKSAAGWPARNAFGKTEMKACMDNC